MGGEAVLACVSLGRGPPAGTPVSAAAWTFYLFLTSNCGVLQGPVCMAHLSSTRVSYTQREFSKYLLAS